VIAMLNDRRARNQKLGGKTASRVTRYACVHECGLIEGILGKIDAANGAT
jgi:hypothetical protein